MPPAKTKRNAIIKQRIENGETYEAIAKDFGITRQRVQRIARKLGVQTNSLKTLAEDRKKVWTRWFAQGFSLSEIARKEGISTSAAWSYCHRNGIKIPEKQLKRNIHGECECYDHGCCCDECRAANWRRYQKTTNKLAPNHGASGYMNYGCRCDVCKAAGSEANRRYYQRRKARLKE